MANQPLAEVFGFPTDNLSKEANRYREHRLCPFGNNIPNCTKDKANNPLGVCSIFDKDRPVITCPIRFRQDWVIAEDAAEFFFPRRTKWTTLTELRLNDKFNRPAGNIDVTVVSYNQRGKVTDFGALEIQAVYISGNVRNPFEYYMQSPTKRFSMDWRARPNYPNPDYLSSSRKRLIPQLIFKGEIIRAWGKKIAVALNKGFFDTLPKLDEVSPSEADTAWFIYDLSLKPDKTYQLVRHKTVYTKFQESLNKIAHPEIGDVSNFLDYLQHKVDEKLENTNPPENHTINEIL